MTEGKIDSLAIKDFSVAPRQVHSFVGEKAAIRVLNPNDRFDMQRWREMDHLLGGMEEFLGKPLADRSIIDDVRRNQPGKTTQRTERYLFGVAGTEQVIGEEVGELQGCIALYPNEEVPQLLKQQLLPKQAKNKAFEVTFVKKPGVPSNQMASALRQVCSQVSQIEAAAHASDETIRPQVYITANVKRGNEDSERVLAASGFEKKGSIVYYDDDLEYDFYVLNWRKLNTIMHDKADATLSFNKNPIK